ncbi:teneurin-3-like [Ranitomeya imitator]|uniref:teneurin-3-like n=1 Tax=Ranitomeya imitator TaxID=111125 RepID=UPI0037E8B8E1
MDVKERRPYCSLTKSRRDKERRYTNSSVDNDDCRVPTQKSYSSSETLKAFDHDSSRLLYGNRVKDLVHREADEYTRQGQNFTLRQLGICEPASRRGLAFCADMGLPHRGYSISAGSDAETENEGVMSPEHAMRLWGRGVKSGRSSCLSSRSNSALTLTDTEHENKSDSETGKSLRHIYLDGWLDSRYLDYIHVGYVAELCYFMFWSYILHHSPRQNLKLLNPRAKSLSWLPTTQGEGPFGPLIVMPIMSLTWAEFTSCK